AAATSGLLDPTARSRARTRSGRSAIPEAASLCASDLTAVCQLQAGPRPLGRAEPPGPGQGHICTAKALAAPADVRGEDVPGLDELDDGAILGRQRRDAAGAERRHAHVAVPVHAE